MLATYCEQYRDLHNHHWWWRAREEYVLTWVRSLSRVRRLEKILDIGCGDGLLFDHLARFGDVRGIEPDDRLVSAQSPWRSRIEHVAFGPDYHSAHRFDLILMLDVLEHIEDDRQSMRTVHELLQPGGYCLLTVPALPSLWSRHDLINCHYRRYTLRALQALTARAGFESVEGHYFFGWTVLPMFLRRLLYPANGPAPREDGAYAVKVPQAFVNWCLYSTCVLEQRLAASHGVPLGSSVFCLVQKPLRPAPAGARGQDPARRW